MCSFTSFDIFAATQTNCFDAKLTGNDEVISKDAKATGFVELNSNNRINRINYEIKKQI
jgi:hypothetical protein